MDKKQNEELVSTTGMEVRELEAEIEHWLTDTYNMCFDFVSRYERGEFEDRTKPSLRNYAWELQHYATHLCRSLREYNMATLSEQARDEIDLARFKYLCALGEYGVSDSYQEGHYEAQALFETLMRKGLIGLKPLGDIK